MVEAGGHGLLTFRRQDLIVVSRACRCRSPELAQVRALGAHIIGELELAARFCEGEVVAITGSNGKTTTTTLVGEILKACGKADAGGREYWEAGDGAGGGEHGRERGVCWRCRAFSWRRWRSSSRGLRWC